MALIVAARLSTASPRRSAIQANVKAGDRVLHAKYAGTEFKLDGAEYLIVGAKDILAIVE